MIGLSRAEVLRIRSDKFDMCESVNLKLEGVDTEKVCTAGPKQSPFFVSFLSFCQHLSVFRMKSRI